MNYYTLSQQEKCAYLMALFAIVKEKYPIYERVYEMLGQTRTPPVQFLDNIYKGVIWQTDNMLEKAQQVAHEQIEHIHQEEQADQADLNQFEEFFSS